MLIQQLVNGLVTGSVYALFSLGFTLVFGVQNILNLAHGSLFMLGGFIGLICITYLGLPFPVALLVAAIGAGLASIVVDLIAFRPLRKRGAPEFSAIITSIGANLIMINLAQRFTESRVLRYPFGTFPIYAIQIAGIRITLFQIFMVAVCLVLVVALVFYLYRTRFGGQIRAVAINERTAGLLGINAAIVYLQTFFISGALAGIAGVLIGTAFNSVHFLMGEPFMLKAFVVVVLGGLGSIPGALIAGMALGVVQTLTIAYVSTGLSDIVIFTILFLALVVRPSGFFGPKAESRRVVRA